MAVKPSTVRTVVGMSYSMPQRLRQLQRRLPALHGVDDILLDRVDLRRRQRALEHIDPGGADRGPLPLGHQIWMHWAAESARWSNCPGRGSTANTM